MMDLGEAGVALIALFAGLLLVAAIIAAAVYAAKAAEKRRQELAQFAQSHGFQCHVAQGSGCLTMGVGGGDWPGAQLLPLFEPFQPFGTGENPRATNLVVGDVGNRTFYFFDYQYETTSTSTDSEGHTTTSKTTHRYGVVAARFPMLFKNLEIRQEGMFDKIGGALGFRDIQFEMEEFNRRFHVTGEDPKFAYDLVHPGMMEFLLGRPERHWQMAGYYLLLHKSGQYSAAEYEEAMGEIQSFLDLVPDYVRQDVGFQPTWTSPYG